MSESSIVSWLCYGTIPQRTKVKLDSDAQYDHHGNVKTPNLFAEAPSSLMRAGEEYLHGDSSGAFGALMGIGQNAWGAYRDDSEAKRTKTSAADAICWSGCEDDQTVSCGLCVSYHGLGER